VGSTERYKPSGLSGDSLRLHANLQIHPGDVLRTDRKANSHKEMFKPSPASKIEVVTAYGAIAFNDAQQNSMVGHAPS
ncbi:hypothetical protein J6590_023397, partial [Homalodisca vitripennis]